MITRNRACLAVGLVAALVYAGVLKNGFAGDDGHIILGNALVHQWSGVWRAFGASYWPPAFGGLLYRPLTLATYAVDWQLGGGGPLWFHIVNVGWHVVASVLVVLLADAWGGSAVALLAGLLFAVHPVHVEAVANVVGRAELMATTFTLAAVYTAVQLDRPWWSAALWGLGLLSKESAGVAPVLVGLAWWAGVGAPRQPSGPSGPSWPSWPSRGQMWLFAGAWGAAGAACLMSAYLVLAGATGSASVAPVFVGHSAVAVRLTAVSEMADLVRLLLAPVTLRVDYSPAERTIVTSVFDGRLLAGLLLVVLWGILAVTAWRRGRRVEMLGMLWVLAAYLPVSNLIVPIGLLMGERTLYLASAGMVLALAGMALRLPVRPSALAAAAACVVALGALRTALRVPIWHDNLRVALSIVEDSPKSYQGPMASAGIFLEARRPAQALEYADTAAAIFPLDPRPYLIGAHAALKLGRMSTADSLLALADHRCLPCRGVYDAEAAVALAMGDTAIADSLRSHLRRRGAR
ncbi:MAG TPA: hypothetical protein VH113_02395 [Gemmatimonadales bacterium]|nr:hypothetical protein [Gemmatimonadales bacterium]